MAHANQHVETEHLSQCTFEVCDVCQKLETLEREVQAIQETLRTLAQQRIALNNSRNAVHDRLSTKLPVELICRIFVLVDNSPDKHPAMLSESEIYFCAPVILSSVCCRWREIALSLPELWKNLHINLGEREKADQIDIIEGWLDRSGAHPLNLTLYSRKDEDHARDQSESSEYHSICKILRKHSARWQHLDLEFAPTEISYTLFNKLQTMPRSDFLELLLGTVHSNKTIFLDPPFRPGRYHASHIDSLRIVPCEWNDLTHLELVYCEIDEALGVIQVAHKLKRCVLENMRHSSLKPALAAPIEHNVLEDLDVTFKNTASVTKFFENITLSSLRHLTYEYLGIRHEQYFYDLKNFLVRSHLSYPSLQTFSLKCYATLLSRPKDILELAGVTHLSIDMHTHLGNQLNILKTLFLKMFNLSVFPHLQDLRIKLGSCPEISTKPGLYQAALSNFVTKHNSQLQLAKDGLEQGMSGHRTVNGIPLPQENAQDLGLINNGTPPYRPLRSISIQLQKWNKSEAEVYKAQRKSESDAVLQECWFLNQA